MNIGDSSYRETVPYWLEGETTQNFGDFLSAYLMDRLFIRTPRHAKEIRIIGSCIDDGFVNRSPTEENQRAPSLIVWGGGVRKHGGVENQRAAMDILSVRGPHSASELALGDLFPIGDPGLLVPALYQPRRRSDFAGQSVCIPHFHDRREDGKLRALSGADKVLRPNLRNDLAEIESFIDALTSARFVICGSLHAAIIAAAYGVPFAFWQSGNVDLPFKWEDFAASVGIECVFCRTIAEGEEIYETKIKNNYCPPPMWPMLACAPFPIRPEALIRLVRYFVQSPTGLLEHLADVANVFERKRDELDKIVLEAEELSAALYHENCRLTEVIKAQEEENIAHSKTIQAQNTERENLLNRLGNAEASLNALGEERARLNEQLRVIKATGDQMAFELRRAYSKPLRPLRKGLHRLAIRLILKFGFVLSTRTREKLRRSLAKRKPVRFQREWDEACGRKLPASISRPKVDVDINVRLYLLTLRALATVISPFRPRVAARFRRSADKRDPAIMQFFSGHSPRAQSHGFQDVENKTALDAPLRGRRILVADYRIPRPDVSAGEAATFGLIADLCKLGYDVVFCPTDMNDTPQYRESLENLGVEVVTDRSGYEFPSDYVRAKGHLFGSFYLIRVDVAEALLPTIRQVASDATTIFHAPDLYFLRESRAAELNKNIGMQAAAEETKRRELAVMNTCDHVVLVSPAEIPELADYIPLKKISVFPALYSPVLENPVGFDNRRNLFFLGGFKHAPNVDSVTWFVHNVWPRIHAALPDVEFHIVGAEAPDEVLALEKLPGVRHIGYVKDLDVVLSAYRLSVAPLLYGAGIKGKLGTSLGAGVPSVCTTIAAEGMSIVDGVHALVKDNPKEFADAVVDLYNDENLWTSLSRHGQSLVRENFSDIANLSSFLRVLDKAGVLAVDQYTKYCQELTPGPFPNHHDGAVLDVSIIIPVFNNWNLTRSCLNSVQLASRATNIKYEVILADDGSTDETTIAADLYPGLRVVRGERNRGFLMNCKSAAAQSSAKYILFLNNDTIVFPNWLQPLVQALNEDPRIAIAGSKLLYPDGVIQETGAVLFADGSAGNLGRGHSRHEPLYSIDREVDYATGASMLVRGEFWREVDGFDERYLPEYCEDSDLAMEARERGYRVVSLAASQAVHFEHGSYAAESLARPKALMLANGVKLVNKWTRVFHEHHVPVGTPFGIAAANAERQPAKDALDRRRAGNLNVLYFSPFPSHPDNHGNQATIQAFGRHFKQMGHKVHFVLLQSDMYDDATFQQMAEAWDSVDILPNDCNLNATGERISFDSWYDTRIGERVRVLCDAYDIDVVFCSYIFQSRLLDYVPAHILKVIDTHDKMGGRYEMLRRNGQPLEFFSCTPEEEGAYLRRAEVVVARRDEEAHYFDSVTGRKSSVVIPHVEEPKFIDRTFDKLKNIGMVASANNINLAMTLQLIKAIDAETNGARVPFVLHIAGQVKEMIRNLHSADRDVFDKPWIKLHGYVGDIRKFYSDVDLVVSPVTMGTGINVKTVQAMAYGMPLLTTRWGSKGIETGHPLHEHSDLNALVSTIFELTREPSRLDELAKVSRARYNSFFDDAIENMRKMFRQVKC